MKGPPRFLLALLLAAGAARAEAPATRDATATARKLFQDGLTLAQQGDLGAALHEFEAAYAARPHFSVLYNIAQTHAALGHPVEAVTTFQRYLADGGKQVPDARRSEVESLITANRLRVGRLRIHGGNATTRVWLDGRELSTEARSDVILLAKGEHSLVVWNGSAAPASRTLLLSGDDVVESTIPEPPPSSSAPVLSLTHLAISCDVPEVEVEVTGAGTIRTPQTKPWLVPLGQLSVRFSRPGYPTLVRPVSTRAGELARLDCDERPLSPVPPQLVARLILALSPADAEVFVDGQRYSGGPLPSGSHQLRVARDGFVSTERRISIEAGRTQLIQLTLLQTAYERERVQRARAHSRTTALVLGGLGLSALAASAGVYVWNSSRYDAWQAKRDRGTATPEDAAQIQRSDDAALGLLIGGGALTLAGVWVFWDSP